MCEYCGCRDIALIGRLSEEHYQAVDGLGRVRRAIEAQDAAAVEAAVNAFAAELFEHNDSEEAGLFHELVKDDYFAPTVTELMGQHRQFREFVARLRAGDWDAYSPLEETLRHHIDREENGLFPATAVAVDGPTWEEIDRLTHDFNHAHHREHGHTEAESLAHPAAGGTPASTAQTHPNATSGHVRASAPAVRETNEGTPALDQSGRGLGVRAATSDDAVELVALGRQAGLGDERPEDLAGRLSGPSSASWAFVATAGDSLVGGVLGSFDGVRGWGTRLVVRPDHAALGVREALLDALETAVRGSGGRELRLLIPADDYPTVASHEARGYVADDVIVLAKPL